MRRFPDSLLRLSIVVAGMIGVALGVRFFVLPSSLMDMEQHKLRATEAESSKPLRFAGATACSDCHEDEPARIASGFHATLSCETCHGTSLIHVEDPSVTPKAPRERDFCPLCHTFDPSRPTGFPQINPVAHNPLLACITCHDPHNPEPPEAPRECSACHAEIWRTKSVSHHVQLECTTCHQVSEGHRTQPRSERPTKPTSREFCGTCHGEDSERSGAPKVDLTAHGGRYLCWQCHYPHFPEAS